MKNKKLTKTVLIRTIINYIWIYSQMLLMIILIIILNLMIESKILLRTIILMSKLLTAFICASLKAVAHSVLVALTIIIWILLIHLICTVLYFTIFKFSHIRIIPGFPILWSQITITFLKVIFYNLFFIVNLFKVSF